MIQAEVSVTVFSCFILWIVEEKKHKTHTMYIYKVKINCFKYKYCNILINMCKLKYQGQKNTQ